VETQDGGDDGDDDVPAALTVSLVAHVMTKARHHGAAVEEQMP